MVRKRSVERIPANLEAVFFWNEKENSGSIADISENGMLVNTLSCPPLRAKFNLTILIKDNVLTIPVKVRRLVKNDMVYEAIGVETLTPPRQYLEFVDSLRWEQIKGVKTSGQMIKVYVCNVCHHISFDHAPVSCPICSSPIEYFEKVPEAIKKPDNFTELSEFEKMHIPVIKLMKEESYIDAHIKIGEIEHPLDANNHISFIDFYYNAPLMNRKCISRVTYNCEKLHPSTTFRMDREYSGVLTVISHCSAHGNWLAKARI